MTQNILQFNQNCFTAVRNNHFEYSIFQNSLSVEMLAEMHCHMWDWTGKNNWDILFVIFYYMHASLYIQCMPLETIRMPLETICIFVSVTWQPFIQAVLLMSVFEQRLSFQMLWNAGEGLEVVWVHDGTLVEVQVVEAPEKVWPFYIWRTNK